MSFREFFKKDNSALKKHMISSALINKKMVSGESLTPDEEEHVNSVSKAIKSSGKTKKAQVLYSGIGFHPHKMNLTDDGTHYHMHLPAFTSATEDYDTAEHFSRSFYDKEKDRPQKQILKLHIPRGSHGIHVQNDVNSHEKEFLIHHGAKIKIRKEPEQINHYTQLWHADLVHDGIKDL